MPVGHNVRRGAYDGDLAGEATVQNDIRQRARRGIYIILRVILIGFDCHRGWRNLLFISAAGSVDQLTGLMVSYWPNARNHPYKEYGCR